MDLRRKRAEVFINEEEFAEQRVCIQCEFVRGNNEPNMVKPQGRGILQENVSKMLKCG